VWCCLIHNEGDLINHSSPGFFGELFFD